MKESDFVDKLLKACAMLMPGGVGFKHADSVTSGIPDVTWTWAGRTLWLECKYEDGEVSSIQQITLRRLAKNTEALVIWLTSVDIKIYDTFKKTYTTDDDFVASFLSIDDMVKWLRSQIEKWNDVGPE
jgi:hypothetical protein